MINNKLIGGLICEFNPLHNGHKYIIDKIKEQCDYLVCVMSGNFVQRGDFALIDKWKRTECALLSGADLVIELPVWNSVSTAEKFAYSSVSIINALGSVDNLYFGSECGNITILKKCAEIVSNDEVANKISENINEGATFAKVREQAVKTLYGEEFSDVFKESNNILGIEYIKALNKLKSSIEPFTIKRYKAGHNDGVVENFASGSELRKFIDSDFKVTPYVPSYTDERICFDYNASIKNLELSILYKLRTMTPEYLINIPDVKEGLHNKIIEAANDSTSLEELYMNVKSKRYSLARIRRIILSAFLGVSRCLPIEPQYIRILGMTKKGEELLKERKNTLPYVLSYSDAKKNELSEYFEFEAKCDSIYALAQNHVQKGNSYYKHPIIKI